MENGSNLVVSIFFLVVQYLEARINHTSHDQQPHMAVPRFAFLSVLGRFEKMPNGPND